MYLETSIILNVIISKTIFMVTMLSTHDFSFIKLAVNKVDIDALTSFYK